PAAWRPRRATTHSWTLGAQIATRSPGSTPAATKARPARRASAHRSAKVRRTSPSTIASSAPKRSAAERARLGIVPHRRSPRTPVSRAAGCSPTPGTISDAPSGRSRAGGETGSNLRGEVGEGPGSVQLPLALVARAATDEHVVARVLGPHVATLVDEPDHGQPAGHPHRARDALVGAEHEIPDRRGHPVVGERATEVVVEVVAAHEPLVPVGHRPAMGPPVDPVVHAVGRHPPGAERPASGPGPGRDRGRAEPGADEHHTGPG